MNRNIIRFFGLGIAVVALSGCALFTPVLGDTASDKTRTYAEYVFQGFRTGWIPALKAYRALPECTTAPAPCYDEPVYKKLYVVTDAATQCMVASTAPGVLLQDLTACLGKVNDAKIAFTQSNIAPRISQP
jgi:hypothetical protein